MFTKAGILLVITAVAGSILAIFTLVPSELETPMLGITKLLAGESEGWATLQYQHCSLEVVAAGEQGEGGYLRSTFRGDGPSSWIAFSMESTVTAQDSLRLRWRARGKSTRLRVEMTVKGRNRTVYSRTVTVPSEYWGNSNIPFNLPVGNPSPGNPGDNSLDVQRIVFIPEQPEEFELHLGELSLVRPTSRWKLAKVVLSTGGFLVLALSTFGLVGSRFRTERSLKDSATYYRSIFNAVSEGIFVLEPKDGSVLDVNEKACRIFEQSREEFLSFDSSGIVGGNNKRNPLSWIRKVLCEEPAKFEWRGKTKGGKGLWLEFNLRKSAIGGEERILAVVSDIKEEKESEGERQRLEQQLLHAQKLEAIGQLAGGVAHDFNNILTSISCSTDLALRGLPPRSLPAAGFRQISELTQRATSLTRQLLAFSRQQALHPTAQSVHQLVENAIKMLTRMIGEDVQLEFKPAARRDTVCADSGQIEQVLMNLAINSRDAMPRGGKLTIETSNVVVDKDHPADVEAGAFLKLSVSDNGQGMDQETRERVFEPFFTTKEVGKGTGLGLSTVYGIVRQHRGDIFFDSQVGEGTVFHIFLPLVEEDAEHTVEKLEEAVPEGSETILLVEDDLNAREIIERVLRAQGYKVHRACSAREARRIFEDKHNEIDLLLTDIVMPGESGVELYQKLLEWDPLIKVLFMSGYTARSSLQNEVLRPGLPFIAKPFGPPELGRKIRETLEHRSGLGSIPGAFSDDKQLNV